MKTGRAFTLCLFRWNQLILDILEVLRILFKEIGAAGLGQLALIRLAAAIILALVNDCDPAVTVVHPLVSASAADIGAVGESVSYTHLGFG